MSANAWSDPGTRPDSSLAGCRFVSGAPMNGNRAPDSPLMPQRVDDRHSRLSLLMQVASALKSRQAYALATSVSMGFVAQALLIVSGVAFARMLGPEDRGYLALLILWPAILWQIGSLGLPVAASYYIARQPSDARSVAVSLIKPALVQTAVLVALHMIVLILFLHSRSVRLVSAGLVSLAYIPPALAWAYLLAILQGQQRYALLNLGRVMPALLTTVGAVVIWFGANRDLVSATAVSVGGLLITCISLGALVARGLPHGPGHPKQHSRRQMLRFGLRALVGSVYPAETFRLDQVFAGLALSPSALGLYVVAGSFTNLPRFAALSIGMVSYPTVAAQPTVGLRRAAMWRYFWITVVVSAAIVGVLLATVSLLVPLFFGRDFDNSAKVAQILLIGGFFLAARRGLSEGLKGAGFPLAGTLSEVSSWVVLVPLMFLLAPIWKLYGVAMAVAASSILSLFVVLACDLVLKRRGAWTEDAPSAPVAEEAFNPGQAI